jgi:hypothetical protein
MTAEQFACWLQGFTELSEWKQPTPEQWKSICEHLNTVFNKVTPPVRDAQKIPPVETAEDAMRRFNESQQRAPSPYGPNAPYWGVTPRITC